MAADCNWFLSLTKNLDTQLTYQHMPQAIGHNFCLKEPFSQHYLRHYEYSQQPYISKELETTPVEDVAMKDSPSLSNSTNMLTFKQVLSEQAQGNSPANPTANIVDGIHNKMVDFEDDTALCIPPCFGQALHEEHLQEEITLMSFGPLKS